MIINKNGYEDFQINPIIAVKTRGTNLERESANRSIILLPLFRCLYQLLFVTFVSLVVFFPTKICNKKQSRTA